MLEKIKKRKEMEKEKEKEKREEEVVEKVGEIVEGLKISGEKREPVVRRGKGGKVRQEISVCRESGQMYPLFSIP